MRDKENIWSQRDIVGIVMHEECLECLRKKKKYRAEDSRVADPFDGTFLFVSYGGFEKEKRMKILN